MPDQPGPGQAMRRLIDRFGAADSRDLHNRSVADPGEFWAAVWDDLGIVGDRGARAWLPGGFGTARFFPDARLNIVDTLLAGDPTATAVVGVGEGSERPRWTRGDLAGAVAAAGAALRAAGVMPGDRVAAWAPNTPEVLILTLAALSMGAVVCTTPTDMAPEAVVDRLTQVDPAFLLVADHHDYGGRHFDDTEAARAIIEYLPSLRVTVRLGNWDAWLAPHRGAPLVPTALPFDYPGFILFTSGTTGRPKCLVHSAAGVLLKVLSEQVYHLDVRPGDRVGYYTTTGWMMWNWLVMALGAEATVVLIDGSPVWPDVDRLIDLAAAEDLSLLGVSARYLDLLRTRGRAAPMRPTCPALRTVASTGSPLAPESEDFVTETLGTGVRVVSMSGGTDICGCFVLGDPTRPVHRGEITGPALGMAVDVVDAMGIPVPDGVTGELICRAPFPTVPLGLWGDDGSRMHEAYFADIPGAWRHGDFITRTASGGFVIHGRSDSTLNASGVRMGTADFYQVVGDLPWVRDCVVVGVKVGNDEEIGMFVVTDGELTEERISEVRSMLRTRRSPRHVPAIVMSVPDVPRTRSGKLAELAVADAVNGRPIRDLSGIANPASLDWFTVYGLSRRMPGHR